MCVGMCEYACVSICVCMRVLIKEDLYLSERSKTQPVEMREWVTYKTNKPGGTVTELGLRAVNRQHPVTSLCRAQLLYTAFVGTRCRYALH